MVAARIFADVGDPLVVGLHVPAWFKFTGHVRRERPN